MILLQPVESFSRISDGFNEFVLCLTVFFLQRIDFHYDPVEGFHLCVGRQLHLFYLLREEHTDLEVCHLGVVLANLVVFSLVLPLVICNFMKTLKGS